MQTFISESTRVLYTALEDVKRAETEHLMQMGRLDLAKQIGSILRKCTRPLTPEEEAILNLIEKASTDTLDVLKKLDDSRANPVLANILRGRL